MKHQIGEVLYVEAEELTLVVTLAGETGVRYIDPNMPVTDNAGRIQTYFATNEAIEESAVSLGHISNISAMCTAQKESK